MICIHIVIIVIRFWQNANELTAITESWLCAMKACPTFAEPVAYGVVTLESVVGARLAVSSFKSTMKPL